jgi:tripartite-type tricarboxylate transporter receptor subunit TctC
MKSGKLRALGASSARRSAAAPEVPTLQEQGVVDFDLVAWFMVYAPAATPTPEVARLRDALQRALANPSVAAKLAELGVEPRPLPASELTAFGQSEIRRWAEATKRSGAQVD